MTSTCARRTGFPTRGFSGRWSREGRIRAGGVESDVAFEEPGPEVDADVDAVHHAKYDRYGPTVVGTVVSPEAARSTLRLVPR